MSLRETNFLQDVARPIRQDEWKRFDVYGSRVRALRCGSLPSLSAVSIQYLSESIQTRGCPLLPQLQKLSITAPLQSPEEVMFVQLLLGPQITHLRLHIPKVQTLDRGDRLEVDLAVARLCRSIRLKTPLLQQVHFRFPPRPFVHDELAQIIDANPSLESIKLAGACESALVLNAISRLPNLRHLWLREWKMVRLNRDIASNGPIAIAPSSLPSLETLVAEDEIVWTIASNMNSRRRLHIYTQTPYNTQHTYPDITFFKRLTGHTNLAANITSIDLYGPNGARRRNGVFPVGDVPAVIVPLLACASLEFVRVRGFGVTSDLESLKLARWPSLKALVWRTGNGATHAGVGLSTLGAFSIGCPSLIQLDLPVMMPYAEHWIAAAYGKSVDGEMAVGALENLDKLCVAQWLPHSTLHDANRLVEFLDRLGPKRRAREWLSGVIEHEGRQCRHLYRTWIDIMSRLDVLRGLASDSTHPVSDSD